MGRSRKRGAEPAPGLVWMMAGFALGLVVAFGVYVAQRAEPGAAALPRPAARAEPPEATPVAASAVTGRAAEGGDAAPRAEPRFQFYELLPEFEVVVPEVESRAAVGPPPAEIAEPGRYVLQVGSFTKPADADRMRASLALLGIESRLQRVAIDDQVFHRVRVGPMSDLREINRIRNRLRDERIDSLLMRAPPEL